MGCGASAQTSNQALQQARMAEEVRVAPLLMRMEEIANLHRRGLMSESEFEKYRSQLGAEIAGCKGLPSSPSGSSISDQKRARQMRADEWRRRVDQLSQQMTNSPDRLPDDYFELLQSLPAKFTHEMHEQEEWQGAGAASMQEYYNGLAGSSVEGLLKDGRTKLDAHDNPLGSQYDLPRDGTMQEHTLVFCWFTRVDDCSYNMPVKALRAKGFNVVVHDARKSTTQQMMVSLLKADVVWLVSGKEILEAGFAQFLDALEAFHRRGGGIFVWGDNAPFFAHANALLSRLFPNEGISLEGNDHGSQIMKSHDNGLTPGRFTRNHLIMTGLNSLFEGVTISYLPMLGPLKVLATYNHGQGYNGKPYCAVADGEVYRRCRSGLPAAGRGRLVVDGGFTKLYDELWTKTAGTERYVKNASTWLLNIGSRIASESGGAAHAGRGSAHSEDSQPSNFRRPQQKYRASAADDYRAQHPLPAMAGGGFR